MKRNMTILLTLFLFVCSSVNSEAQSKNIDLSQLEIGKALKEALDHGVKNQVSKLTAKDGFFKNELVQIALPGDLKKVDKRLRRLGLGKLTDQGLLLLNRAAEDAVKTATPIFVEAIKEITFDDAKKLLLGDKKAATTYLEDKTYQSLYKEFSPVIQQSFEKVGADKIWEQIISKYNGLPFVKQQDPDLTAYVTEEALKGVFTMIALEEEGIRKKIGLRDTELLRQVFSLQDLLNKN